MPTTLLKLQSLGLWPEARRTWTAQRSSLQASRLHRVRATAVSPLATSLPRREYSRHGLPPARHLRLGESARAHTHTRTAYRFSSTRRGVARPCVLPVRRLLRTLIPQTPSHLHRSSDKNVAACSELGGPKQPASRPSCVAAVDMATTPMAPRLQRLCGSDARTTTATITYSSCSSSSSLLNRITLACVNLPVIISQHR